MSLPVCADDAACLCANANFGYGVRDCGQSGCGATDVQIQAYLAGSFCQVGIYAYRGTSSPDFSYTLDGWPGSHNHSAGSHNPSTDDGPGYNLCEPGDNTPDFIAVHTSANYNSTSYDGTSYDGARYDSVGFDSDPFSVDINRVASSHYRRYGTLSHVPHCLFCQIANFWINKSSDTSRPSTTATSTVPVTSATAPSSPSSSETSAAVPQTGGSGLSRGAAVGIGVGVAGGVVAIAFAAVFLLSKNRNRAPHASFDISQPPSSGHGQGAFEKYSNDIEMVSNRYEDMVPRQQPRVMV
ncbi:extracellular membrane [Trichoderma cornu-damae]|uniref:Extracellular membrane n=1 Tax=Trichoderma cornu-damae TaxID=654480 RepID=A0A9P8QT23_9HYPO|nr:extracellular membrane [Trichoderma cornu-damae]